MDCDDEESVREVTHAAQEAMERGEIRVRARARVRMRC